MLKCNKFSKKSWKLEECNYLKKNYPRPNTRNTRMGLKLCAVYTNGADRNPNVHA